MGLAELYLGQKRWDEMEAVVERVERVPGREADGLLMRGRLYLGRKEPARARRLLEEAIPRFAESVPLRLLLSHALLQEGRDWAGAEKALLDVLALDPDNQQAKENLQTLRRRGARS
jgi:hypothetical protein